VICRFFRPYSMVRKIDMRARGDVNIHDLKTAYEKAIGHSTSDSTVYKPRSAAHPRICRALPGSDLKHRARPLAALPRPSA
jgi:hypothetical protein